MTDSKKPLVSIITEAQQMADAYQISFGDVVEAMKVIEMQKSNELLDQLDSRLSQICEEMYRG